MSSPRRPLVNGLAWDRDRIVVETDDAIGKIDKPHLSASTSKTIHQCPARHVADRLLPEKTDLFAPAPLGTAAHTVLERLYQMGASRRDRRAATAIRLALGREYTVRYPEVMSDPITYERWMEEVTRCYLGIFDMEDPTGVTTTYQERRLDGVLVAEVPFKGFIDRQDEVTARGRTGARVIDYKTGKLRLPNQYGDDHGDQLRLYGEAVRVLDGELPLEAKVYYTTHREIVSVPLGRKFMEPTLAAFHDSWVDLRSYVHERTFPTRTSTLCGWCPLVNACPAAKREGKVDRVGTAPSEVELGIPQLRPGAKRRLDNLDDGYEDVYGVPEPPADEYVPDLPDRCAEELEDGNYVPEPEPGEDEFFGKKRKRLTVPEYIFDPYAQPGDMTADEYRARQAAQNASEHREREPFDVEPVEPYEVAHRPVDESLIDGQDVPWEDREPPAEEDLEDPDEVAPHSEDPFLNDDVSALAEPPVAEEPACSPYGHDDHCPDCGDCLQWQGESRRTWNHLGAVESPCVEAGRLRSFEDLNGDSSATPSHSTEGRTMSTATDREDTEMSERVWREGRPYDGPEVDGHLSLNSYAATAVFGVTKLATEVLAENEQPLSRSMVSSLTSLLARVVLGAQQRITFGDTDWQSGANTRVRGALRTVIKTMPLPFGGDAQAWENWRIAATTRCTAIAAVAIETYETGPRDDDVTILARNSVAPASSHLAQAA